MQVVLRMVQGNRWDLGLVHSLPDGHRGQRPIGSVRHALSWPKGTAQLINISQAVA